MTRWPVKQQRLIQRQWRQMVMDRLKQNAMHGHLSSTTIIEQLDIHPMATWCTSFEMLASLSGRSQWRRNFRCAAM